MKTTEPQPQVLMDSNEAATLKSVTGWVSRDGFFYGNNESTARYAGCTHRRCEGGCGEIIDKHRLYCPNCTDKRDIERYWAKPSAPWDGSGMIYSDRFDEYTTDPDEFLREKNEEAEEWNAELEPEDERRPILTADDCRFMLCKRAVAREIDPSDYYDGDLPEDGDVPAVIEAAFDELNAKIREADATLCYWSGETRWNGEMTT